MPWAADVYALYTGLVPEPDAVTIPLVRGRARLSMSRFQRCTLQG